MLFALSGFVAIHLAISTRVAHVTQLAVALQSEYRKTNAVLISLGNCHLILYSLTVFMPLDTMEFMEGVLQERGYTSDANSLPKSTLIGRKGNLFDSHFKAFGPSFHNWRAKQSRNPSTGDKGVTCLHYISPPSSFQGVVFLPFPRVGQARSRQLHLRQNGQLHW